MSKRIEELRAAFDAALDAADAAYAAYAAADLAARRLWREAALEAAEREVRGE